MLFIPPAPVPEQPNIEYIYEPPTRDLAIYTLIELFSGPGLDEYFRQLTTIQRDIVYALPSGNRFKVTYDGIVFRRKGKQELWEIEAKNKGASLRVDRVTYEQDARKIRVTAIKYGIPFKQEPQFLSIDEIVNIFTALESDITYTRPNNKPTGAPYKLILQVEKKN